MWEGYETFYRKTEAILRRYQYVIFALYAAILIFTAIQHEPWMDEAQAWLLAKDASLKEIFFTYLKYEGTPGLWHLLLYIPAKLGLPYWTITVISTLFSAAGVYLFVRYAPFSIIIKLLYPFTYFAFFQYGVIARSYCIIPVTIFAVAIFYKQRMQRPLLYVSLLFIFANISAHTFLIAGSLVFLFFIEIINEWYVLNKKDKIKYLAAIGLYGILAGCVVFILIPPSDHMLAAGINADLIHFLNVSVEMIMGSLNYNHLGYFPFVQFALAAAVFVTTLIWLKKVHAESLYILPLVLLCILFAAKYKNLWHQGVLFYLWLFILWVTVKENANFVSVRLLRGVKLMMVFVFCIHVYWCVSSIVFDITNKYSGSYQVASFIKKEGLQNKKIFASGWKTAAVLPYFDENIFYNYNEGADKRFWIWSTKNATALGIGLKVLDTIEKDQPDVVVIASHYIPSSKRISLAGYKVVANINGFIFWKSRKAEPECFLIFKKREPANATLDN